MTQPTDFQIRMVAAQYATNAHERVGQRRKYIDNPYIVHSAQVAQYLRGTIHDNAIASSIAVNHDVLEDTRREGQSIPEAANEMRTYFIQHMGSVDVATWITSGVLQVTDISVPEDGNRAVRKAIDRDHAARAEPQQQTIKVADTKSNMPSIVKHDPGFARKWVAEKAEVMKLMTAADPVLHAEVMAMIEAYYAGTFNPDAYVIV